MYNWPLWFAEMTSTSKSCRLSLTSMSLLISTSSRPSGNLCLLWIFFVCCWKNSFNCIRHPLVSSLVNSGKSHSRSYLRMQMEKGYETERQRLFSTGFFFSLWFDLNLDLFSADSSCGVSVCLVKLRRSTEWWKPLLRDTATATPVSSRALVK